MVSLGMETRNSDSIFLTRTSHSGQKSVNELRSVNNCVEFVTEQFRMSWGAKTFGPLASTFSFLADQGSHSYPLRPVAHVCASDHGGVIGRTYSVHRHGPLHTSDELVLF